MLAPQLCLSWACLLHNIDLMHYGLCVHKQPGLSSVDLAFDKLVLDLLWYSTLRDCTWVFGKLPLFWLIQRQWSRFGPGVLSIKGLKAFRQGFFNFQSNQKGEKREDDGESEPINPFDEILGTSLSTTCKIDQCSSNDTGEYNNK